MFHLDTNVFQDRGVATGAGVTAPFHWVVTPFGSTINVFREFLEKQKQYLLGFWICRKWAGKL